MRNKFCVKKKCKEMKKLYKEKKIIGLKSFSRKKNVKKKKLKKKMFCIKSFMKKKKV